MPVDVGRVTTKKSGKPTTESLIFHGERDKIQIETPKDNRVASIDLGINMLATVTVDEGVVLFYRGPTVKADYFYFQKEVAGLDRLEAEAEKVQTEAREEVLREREGLFKKLAHFKHWV
nr:transposase [Metallosphaera tengchongensis]